MTEIAARLGGYMPDATPQFADPERALDGYVSTLIPIPNYNPLSCGPNKYLSNLSTRELLV